MHIHPTNRPNLAYEIYVTDGTCASVPTRNYHGVSLDNVPARAIACLAVHDASTSFTAGTFAAVPNIRAKAYRGELELEWNALMTVDQDAAGWTERRVVHVDASDERAQAIER